MPDYSYSCPVCSHTVAAAQNGCEHCGTPAICNGYQLQQYQQRWADSDQQRPMPLNWPQEAWQEASSAARALKLLQIVTILPASALYAFLVLVIVAAGIEAIASGIGKLISGKEVFFDYKLMWVLLWLTAGVAGLTGLWRSVLSYGKKIELWLLVPGALAACPAMLLFYQLTTEFPSSGSGFATVLAVLLFACIFWAGFFIFSWARQRFSTRRLA